MLVSCGKESFCEVYYCKNNYLVLFSHYRTSVLSNMNTNKSSIWHGFIIDYASRYYEVCSTILCMLYEEITDYDDDANNLKGSAI